MQVIRAVEIKIFKKQQHTEVQLGPYISGHHFGSVHHHNGHETKSRYALNADIQL